MSGDETMPVADRFWAKVAKGDGCWDWLASKKPDGYGQFFLAGRIRLAHRVAYELEVGSIPDGLQLDHRCRNRACVRPDHLEPVTSAENQRRGKYAMTTHCAAGHQYTAENTYRRPSTGRRDCRACHRRRERQRKQARRQKKAG